MTINLLEFAIKNNQVGDFFRGKGQYFLPSPDYEGHVHGANMGGFARVFAEQSNLNSTIFDDAFLFFLKDLAVSKEDVGNLLSNLSSYFSQKSRGAFSESIIFLNSSSQGSLILQKYFSKINHSSFVAEVKDQIVRHAKFIRNKGSSLLIDIVDDLHNIKE